MKTERVAHLGAGLKPMFRLVFDRAHKNSLHLAGERGIDLSRSRILGKVEDEKRIVLRV